MRLRNICGVHHNGPDQQNEILSPAYFTFFF